MPEGDTIHYAANTIRPVLEGRIPDHRHHAPALTQARSGQGHADGTREGASLARVPEDPVARRIEDFAQCQRQFGAGRIGGRQAAGERRDAVGRDHAPQYTHKRGRTCMPR